MKLIYLHQYFNTPAMAGGTRSYEVARRLVSSGHEVHMVTTDQTPATPTSRWYQTDEAGIDVHWLPIAYDNRMTYARRLKAFFAYALRAGTYAARIGGDIVFASSTPLTVALPGMYASRRLGVPLVFEVRDLWPDVPIAMGALRPGLPTYLARRLEWTTYRHSAHVVALSPGMRDGVLRSGIAPERVHVIPNGSDTDLFYPDDERGELFRAQHAWLGERPLVLYAGAIGKVNGVEYLARVAAATIAVAPEVRFLVLGAGAEEDRVRTLAEELGVLDRNFFMLPRLPKSDVPAAFAAATLTTSLVIDNTVLWDNSANKVFDSLAAGRPIAINYGGWQAALLEEEGAGLVLPPRDVTKARDLIIGALQDPVWLDAAGERARRLAETRFERGDLVRQLESVLLSALGPQAAGGSTTRRPT
jgi:glycosyltransferase involved in cell wall biosynthesis